MINANVIASELRNYLLEVVWPWRGRAVADRLGRRQLGFGGAGGRRMGDEAAS